MAYTNPEDYRAWKRRYLQRPEIRTRNREYQREYRRQGRRKPPSEEQQERERQRRAERLKFIQDAKAQPCVDCGRQLAAEKMDFDHVRGEKLFPVTQGVGRTMAALQAEMAKCEVRCKSCHSRRHALERWAKHRAAQQGETR